MLLCFTVAGVLLVTCLCGGVSGTFSEFPFEAREHLIIYHTEGRGEDKVKYSVRQTVCIQECTETEACSAQVH